MPESDLKTEINRLLEELRSERENFSGHYEANPYNGINIFSNVEVPKSLKKITEEFGISVSSELLIGVCIAKLCELSLLYDLAIESNDRDKLIKGLNINMNILDQIDTGVLKEHMTLDAAFRAGFIDAKFFSSSLLGVYEDYVR